MDNTARRLLIALAALVAVLLPGTPAWAHNSLVEAQPAKGATVPRPPAEVRLRFLQALDPARTTITVSAADGGAVAVDGPRADGRTGRVTFREPLPGGAYTVAYEVTSTDGHVVKGSYRFTVAGPAGTAAASPSAPSAPPAVPQAAAAAAATEDDGPSTALLAGLVVLGAVLAGTAVVLLLRRRRSAG